MEYTYNKLDELNMAKASATNLKISLKKGVELAKELRRKKASRVVEYLEKVIIQKQVVPYRKYRAEMGHKKGKGVDTGGYPVNVAIEFLKVIKSAISNAKDKSIDEKDLKVLAFSVRKGITRYSYGRYSGRKMKSTNCEVIVGISK